MLNDNINLYSPGPIAQSVDPQTKQMTTYENQKLMFVWLILLADNLDKQFLPSSGLTKFGASSGPTNGNHYRFFLFVWFVDLRPKSTAMVMAGRPVQLSTLFPGQV